MVRHLDRAGIHAMIDIAIDQAEADLAEADGHGISLQGANGPHFSCMFVAGEHPAFTPRQIVSKSMEFAAFMTSCASRVEHRKGLTPEETQVEMKKKLTPQPPSPN